ncbi:LOW QUALITY PROTEIN: mas-related G-protein coupled receptor member G [Camelus ferus]|uniref:LOW QUALITY PROTEIN: mas-related G-protein coupled receptor member G n=1 Tax=Camelus ferus TaxID=419612 RepID=A0A8B7K407_CAMFR|nr:LOW QUALITY PROTEIN: mas-related G-protein coupled receptor member G [Camelus ferus]
MTPEAIPALWAPRATVTMCLYKKRLGGQRQDPLTPQGQGQPQRRGPARTLRCEAGRLREAVDGSGAFKESGPGVPPAAREPASMLGLWRTFNSVVSYITLAVSLGELVGNGLVLWHLGFHMKKGPFSVYVLHLTTADFLFLGGQGGLYLTVPFVAFSVGLWLLAAFSAERCLSDIFPTCYQGCRPRHTAGIVCGLIWALTPLTVLLPANACGQLPGGTRLQTCPWFHTASVAWLLTLACGASVAGLVLFIWVACCSQRQLPQFYGVVLGSVLLFFFCGLSYILYWILSSSLDLLLSWVPMQSFLRQPYSLSPLPTLLACIHCSSKPLIYFTTGRQPGKREPLREALQRSLGEGAPLGAGEVSLPMGRM